MKEIEILINLQKIDSQIFLINEQLRAKPKEINVLENDFSGISAGLKKLEDDLKKEQLIQKDKELELQSKEDTVNKQKGQLSLVKTNKEYNALQLEIEKLKADNSLLEEDIIVLLEKVDNFKKAVTEERERVAAQEKNLNESKKVVELDIQELKQKLDALMAERKRAVEGTLKPEVLDRYQRILNNRGEMALAVVKDNICSGCSMGLRPQVVNELKLGKMLTCDNCSRILYVETNE